MTNCPNCGATSPRSQRRLAARHRRARELAKACTHKSRLVCSGWSMSVFPPEADIRVARINIRFVPETDLTRLNRYLGALLIAGLHAAQTGHVLELVCRDTGR